MTCSIVRIEDDCILDDAGCICDVTSLENIRIVTAIKLIIVHKQCGHNA